MPYLKISTNKNIDKHTENDITLKVSSLVAELLGKPESYVMTEINSGVTMTFAGNAEPLAYLEMKSIGLPENKTAVFSESLCAFIHENMGISPDRIYLEFADARRNMWGWNGSTF